METPRPPIGAERRDCDECRLGRVSVPDGCPFREIRRSAGQFLAHQNEDAGRLWFLKQGQVALSSTSASGQEHSCALRGPGTLLGVEALAKRPLPYQLRALTDIVACEAPVSAVLAWMGTLDSPTGTILELLVQEVEQKLSERHAVVGSAVSRLAKYLVAHAEGPGGNRPLTVPLRMVSQTLAMRPETLSRAMATLRAAGAVARGRTVVVRDLALLRELCDHDDAEHAV